MVGGGPGKIQQLFANKVFKGNLKPESGPDRLSRLALLDLNLMEFALRHRSFPIQSVSTDMM
jgi:hypothetical protein